MYSAFQRVSVLSGFLSSCLMITLIIVALGNFIIPIREPFVNLAVNRVQLRRGTEDYYVNKPTWLADLSLDIEADFSGLFHWNTKLLFVYLVLEYQTAKNVRNELVVWDKIIRVSDYHRLDLHGVRPKYPPCDIDDNGTDAKLKMYWNTVPHVGLLTDSQRGETSLQIPN